jgi:pyrroloquinoline quinone biosynthesis protein B
LINASPDFSRQIETTPELQPCRDSPRNSPIAGVLLTNADLDHCLGLVLMRQRATPLVVYATDKTRAALGWIDIVLEPFCGIGWRPAAGDFQPLGKSIAFRAIESGKSIAFQLRDEISGASALVAPAVSEITSDLREAANNSDIVLFDGTFWSDDELIRIQGSGKTARQMGHVPVSSATGSLSRLAGLRRPRKIYVHINNTNPMLNQAGPEYRQVRAAGWEIAEDGWEFDL